MKKLSEREIRFIKETHFTPTVVQCNEWHTTPFENAEEAYRTAYYAYGVNIISILDKMEEDDSISLEYTATYLFYIFFTKEQLEELTPKAGLDWLQSFKYFCGYRKWDVDFVEQEINEALEIYSGTREFYECENGEIWNRKVE